jgi:hypothetical protein
MTDAELKLYVGAVEYGIAGKPIIFTNALAGEITEHPLNPFYLWNDKGGVLNSVPANTISVTVADMWVQDEILGTSDGTVNQTYNTFLTPILTGTLDDLVLKVGTTEWTKVSNFAGQGVSAEVFTVSTVGLVTFGDGVNGKIPTLGENITLTYTPDLALYGKNVYEGLWFEIKSFGVTTNAVVVTDEVQISLSTTLVTVSNVTVSAVTGVWLQGDPGHSGTNYFTGGSFDMNTGELTLGVALPSATTAVIVTYSYLMIDDLESSYTAIGEATSHTFTNQIPQNNAKLLYFRMNIPATATPSGGSNFCFRLKFTYLQ